MLEFKIYKFDFTCDCCGEETCMGIVGFSKLVPKICDLCLINGVDGEDIDFIDNKEQQAPVIKSDQDNGRNT